MLPSFSHKQTIKIKPKVKQRPRMTRRGRVFTPMQTLEFERAIAEAWTGPCADEPVNLVIGLYKNKITLSMSPASKPAPSGLRGDIDNYAKSILDGLNGIAYTDDKLVKRLLVTKHE
jgi:Holliday junction resolvase RusA-like endonuclease